MHRIAVVLACLTCSGFGRRINSPVRETLGEDAVHLTSNASTTVKVKQMSSPVRETIGDDTVHLTSDASETLKGTNSSVRETTGADTVHLTSNASTTPNGMNSPFRETLGADAMHLTSNASTTIKEISSPVRETIGAGTVHVTSNASRTVKRYSGMKTPVRRTTGGDTAHLTSSASTAVTSNSAPVKSSVQLTSNASRTVKSDSAPAKSLMKQHQEAAIARLTAKEKEAKAEYHRQLARHRNEWTNGKESLDLLENAKLHLDMIAETLSAAESGDAKAIWTPLQAATIARLEADEKEAKSEYSRLLSLKNATADIQYAAKIRVQETTKARVAAESGDFTLARTPAIIAEIARLKGIEDEARHEYDTLLDKQRKGDSSNETIELVEAANKRVKKAASTRFAAESGNVVVDLRLEVSCDVTNEGESVFAVGSLPEFGSWDPRAGLRLSTNSTTYPVWAAELGPLAVTDDEEVEFKFIVQRDDDQTGRILWEMMTENRRLELKSNQTVRLNWNTKA